MSAPVPVPGVGAPAGASAGCSRHEALLYAGEAEFAQRCAAFVRDGLAADEPVLVAVPGRKVDVLRDALRGDAREICLIDMSDTGRNPARIIPVWREFVDSRGGGAARGIGEPIWAGRSPDELAECQRHEALLNLALAGGPPLWLLCPYDVEALDAPVVAEARRHHPFLWEGGVRHSSARYDGDAPRQVLEGRLPSAPPAAAVMSFGAGPLDAVRNFVREHAAAAGLDASRTPDLVMAVHELVTNSLRHGGGHGTVQAWQDGGSVICEIADGGCIAEVLVGRVRPAGDEEGGYGLWLVNQLCDLVQVRSSPHGTVVRVHMSYEAPA